MKRIEAVIQPEALEAVKQALLGIGLTGLHAESVAGHGRQGGVRRAGRGGQLYVVDMIDKVKVTAIVADERAEDAITAIIDSARSGNTGDGKIFVSRVADAIRVRTKEAGADVL